MSDNVCPMCGYSVILCSHSKLDLAEEIARLKAELEKAEMERGDWQRGYERWIDKYYRMCNARNDVITERDEAQKWALFYQALAQSWKKAYESTWKNNRVMPK